MISVGDDVWRAMGGARVTACRVESWRGGELLAADVPVVDGTLTGDRSLQVPEQVTLSVPVEADGQRWDPLDEGDPLGAWGQRLQVSVEVEVYRRRVRIPRGGFLITSSSRDGDTVSVQATNLLQLIAEARLATPLQPAPGDTLKRLARRLVEPALPVVFDAGLTDRAVPTSSLQWDDDRIGALYELAAAWPAELRVHPSGYLQFVPPTTNPDPDAWVEDAREAVVRPAATTNRDGAVNCIVARGTDSDSGLQYQAVAYDRDPASPTRWGGPFSPLPVPRFFSSPLLTSNTQCLAAALSMLARRKRASTRSIVQDMDPAPYLELGDILLTRDDRRGMDVSATVEAMTLPLIPDGGPMTLSLAVI